MPAIDWTTMSADDYHFRRNIRGRQLKFTLLPRRCHVTKRIIWLKNAYRVTASYRTYDNMFLHEHRWYDKDEYLIARLKDLI
jgi:hypothetical protein